VKVFRVARFLLCHVMDCLLCTWIVLRGGLNNKLFKISLFLIIYFLFLFRWSCVVKPEEFFCYNMMKRRVFGVSACNQKLYMGSVCTESVSSW
jgi:hypothetical protein